jgi:hypothetical protein
MVTGFEQFSYELNQFETQHILPIVITKWQKRKSHFKKVSMKQMIDSVNQVCVEQDIRCTTGKNKGKHYKIDGPRMRKIIHYIRVRGIVKDLVATSKGYFRSDDPQEIKNFIKSCRERANSFLEVANAMETYNFER